MVKNVQIIRVNENNWQNYKWFLGYGMKNEFPADEQLSMDQILHRVATPTEHD